MQAMAANTTGSTIRARAQMTPRTFDISGNLFDGWFPEWMVEKVAACKEDITLILDVRTPSFLRLYTPCITTGYSTHVQEHGAKLPVGLWYPGYLNSNEGLQGTKLAWKEQNSRCLAAWDLLFQSSFQLLVAIKSSAGLLVVKDDHMQQAKHPADLSDLTSVFQRRACIVQGMTDTAH